MGVVEVSGDIFAAEALALVNPVNTQGVMGKGLALAFKNRFPDNFRAYREACRVGQVRIGEVFPHHRSTPPAVIFNFPTKAHWRQPSRLEYIEMGMVDLVRQIQTLGVRSIALPRLGCGLGGLDWHDVRPVVVDALVQIPGLESMIF